jgi:serine/threonine protein kinase
MSTTELDIAALGRPQPLGHGGTAVVYLVPDLRLPEFPGERFVYKKYNDKTKQVAGPALGRGLTNFVQFRGRLPANQQRAWDARIIWPIAVVKDGNDAADGIIMRLIPDRFFHDFKKREGGVNRKPREIETLFGDNETARRKGLPDVKLITRLQLVRAIAAAYSMMHKEGVVLGDISGRNIIYDPDPRQPAIMVVDVDSARIRGNRSTFGVQPHTPNWQPPEAMAASDALHRAQRAKPPAPPDVQDRLHNTWAIQSVKTDVYKFGLMTVRILDYGRGRAVNRDPAQARKILSYRLGPEAAKLLDASMSAQPNDRPQMREWYHLLAGTSPVSSIPTQPSPIPGVPRGQPGPANGDRQGNWQWEDGTGWVRVPRP